MTHLCNNHYKEATDFIAELSEDDRQKILTRIYELRDLYDITEEGATIMAVELAKKGGDKDGNEI